MSRQIERASAWEICGSSAAAARIRNRSPAAEMPTQTSLNGGVSSDDWTDLIAQLCGETETPRTWHLSADGRLAWEHHRARWKQRTREPEPAGVITALGKADRHLARITQVLVEAESPGLPFEVGSELVEHGAAIVDFTLDCWRAMPDNVGLGLSRREEKLVRAVERWLEWLETRPKREATARELRIAHVGGVRNVKDYLAVLEAWKETYPRTVRDEVSSGTGPRSSRPRNGVESDELDASARGV